MVSMLHVFVIHVIFHYVFLNGIEIYNPFKIRYSLGKMYLSFIAGFAVILIMVLHNNRHFNTTKKYTILSYTFAIAFLTYLYRNQVFINDKQFLIEMLDQSETSLLINNKIIIKTENELVKAFASKINHNRASELNDINTILHLCTFKTLML